MTTTTDSIVFLILGRGNGSAGAANIYWSLVSPADIGRVLNTLDDGTAEDEGEAEREAASRLRFHDFTVGDWRDMTDDDAAAIDALLGRFPLTPMSVGLAADAHRRGRVVRVASLA